MKKIIAIILAISIVFVFAGCTQKEETPVEKTYTPLTYTDFNNLASEKGYEVIENTNNTAVNFDKSFYIESNEKNGFNIVFYQFKDAETAFKHFNVTVLTYESFSSEHSFMERNQKHGLYMVQDKNNIIYMSYVGNTVMLSILANPDDDAFKSAYNEMLEFLTYIKYPIQDLQSFSK